MKSILEKLRNTNWSKEDIDFEVDLIDWNIKLSDSEKSFLGHTIDFLIKTFTINNELIDQINLELHSEELDTFKQLYIEIKKTHFESLTLFSNHFNKHNSNNEDNYRESTSKKTLINNKIQKKIKDESYSPLEKLLFFFTYETIHQISIFCTFFKYNRKNKLLYALNFTCEEIYRDNSLISEYASKLYLEESVQKIPKERINQIISEIVNDEIHFLKNITSKMQNIDISNIENFIKYKADKILLELGYEKYYHTKNPIELMNELPRRSPIGYFLK